ncbi:MFS transporter [Massilia sp. W12]|uniref:MFS transporter n=1 Tax=Massilia sp. W12 TaxID=3126507 RepID=UPI0030CDD252
MEGQKLLKSKIFWIGLLYFSEGFPLGLFYDLFPVYFRQQGVDLSKIGVISLLGLCWTLKFIWAPLIDFTRRHRYWMVAADVGMGLIMLQFAINNGYGPWVWLAIGLFTAMSATNDIAIDGYTIEQLDQREMGLANGIRIGMYRVGMLMAGILLWCSDALGWTATWGLAALFFLLLGLTCLNAPPEPPRLRPRDPAGLWDELDGLQRQPLLLLAIASFFAALLWPVVLTLDPAWAADYKKLWWYKGGPPVLLLFAATLLFRAGLQAQTEKQKQVAQQGPLFGALIALLQKPHAGLLLLFILIFKLADASIGFMIKPFWVDSGFTNAQIGMVSVNIGLGLSIAGGLVGGWYTDRVGIFKALWVLGLFQAVSNLGYVLAAAYVPHVPQGSPIAFEHQMLMYGASVIESFTGGLGTAAFMAFLMAIVDKERATTEYALLSSVFAFSRSIAGWAGGIGAQDMGYMNYFLLTFILAFPAYILLPWIKQILQQATEKS